MTNQEYYRECRTVTNKLNLELLKGTHPGQPTDVIRSEDEQTGAEIKKARYVYLTSIANTARGSTASAKTEDGRKIPAVSLAEVFGAPDPTSADKMTVSHAARCLVNQTHRVSTEAEIMAHIEHQEQNLRESNALDLRNYDLKMRNELPRQPSAPLPRSSKILGKGKDGQA